MKPAESWLYITFIVLVQLGFVVTCSLFVAAVAPIFPDFRYLVVTGLQLLMFGSGIFYSYEEVLLEEHRHIFLLNPMANIINSYRDVLLEHTVPDLTYLTSMFMVCVVLSLLLLFFFEKKNSMYSKLVVE